MSKAVGIIPARWASTRFPGKLLHPIAGIPVLRRVIDQCQRSKALDNVIVATDDMRIAEAAFDWGAEVAMTSPRHASGTDRIAEVARKMRDARYVINVQGDEPLVDPKLIDRMVAKLRADSRIEMVTAAHPFADPADASSPHQVKVVLDRQHNALFFSRSPIPFPRDAEPARFLRHQGIYGYTRDLLLRFVRWKVSPLEKAESLEQLRALENGVKIHVLLTTHGSPGIDTPEDVKTIERLLRSKNRRRRA